MMGREIVILGSGDIGLIMARRLTLEGAKVKMVLEILPYVAVYPEILISVSLIMIYHFTSVTP
jgi:S-adenosylhomocysteine hydrolase